MTKFRYLNKAIITSISLLALTSCGGSNSSTSPVSVTPPPAPTVTNQAPTISFTATDLSPFEGLSATIDASASSDPENDSLTYLWVQKSGPSLEISGENTSITEISIPELSQDENAVIELQVSDGDLTTIEEISLTLKNVDLQPRYSEAGFQFSPEVLGEYEYSGNLMKFVNVSADNFAVYENGQVDGLEYDGSNLLVTSNDNPFELTAEHTCSSVRVSNFLLVGQSNGGIQILKNDYQENMPDNFSIVETIEEASSICLIRNNNNHSAMAIDENTGEVLLLRFVDASGNFLNGTFNNFDDLVSLAVAQRLSPVLNLPNGVNAELVKAVSYNSSFLADRGLLLLYSDGEVDGNHRAVLARHNLDNTQTSSISFEVLEWTYGIPQNALSSTIDGISSNLDEVIITTKDSPFAVVFSLNGNVSFTPEWSGPFYMEVGLGATNIAPLFTRNTGNNLLLNYPEEKKIKLLDPSP